MSVLENYFNSNLRYNFLNKLNHNKSLNNIPKIKKLILTVKISKYKTKELSLNFLVLELLTKTKKLTKIQILKIKKPNLILKIRKGTPIGGKIILKNKLKILNTLTKIYFPLLKKNQNLNFKTLKKMQKSYLTISIKNNILNFKKINLFYSLFTYNSFNFTVNIVFNNKLKKKLATVFRYLC
jgi:ribosomal protein L5